MVVLFFAGFIWLMGAVFRQSVERRLIALTFLYLFVLLSTLQFDVGAGPRAVIKGSTGEWLVFGMVAAFIALYAMGIKYLRAKTAKKAADEPTVAPAGDGPFAEGEITRYARHIMLREIGGLGQKRLKEASVLVIGAGGLGAPALLYLSAAGVGRIGIVDDDVVDLSNLQRQVIHSETELGLPKVRSAACAMKALNTHVVVDEHALRLTEGNAKDLMSGYDIILDGCDNFATRYLVNEMAQALGIPLISAALSQWEGQISVYDVKSGTPCYQCIFPEAPAEGLAPSCAEAGVLGPLPGVVGAMMAAETVKLITGAGETLKSQMLIYDALYGETRKIALKPRVDCPICAQMR